MTTHIYLECDGCHGSMGPSRSAALTLFDGNIRRDFCTNSCFGVYVRKWFGDDGKPNWKNHSTVERLYKRPSDLSEPQMGEL